MMMELRIADTFTDSLAVLSNDEQKAVKNKAFDLQMNPANPGFKFHKIERAKDPNFWSARVDRDLRIILHKTRASLLLCYVGHHDDAYQVGRAAQARNPPPNRRRATGGNPRDHRGNHHSPVCGGG